MGGIWSKIPFMAELLINGSFITLYSLSVMGHLPPELVGVSVEWILEIGSLIVPIVLFISVISNYIRSDGFYHFLRKYVFSLIVFIPLVITWGDVEFALWLSSAHLIYSILVLYDVDRETEMDLESVTTLTISQKKYRNLLQYISLRPAQIVLLSFIGLILFGTFLLMLPFSSVTSKSIGLVDSIFTATSATCVTGLNTLSLQDNFSLFGQLVILALIQIGGLGIMTLSSSMTILLGRSMGMRDRIIMQDLLDVSSMEGLISLILDIIKYTFLIELWGAIILTVAFTFEGYEFGDALYYGFFHSISAFCNAGFSLFNTSLESYATNPMIHGTVAVLVTLGGLGFIVLREMKEVIVSRRSLVRIGLHTKIVLITSFALIVLGALFIFFGEFLNALDGYTLWEKVQISLFQSITLRTAGFNTIPIPGLHTYTIYVMALFMFIGASPGSTGGGVKTTTLAILVQSIKSTLKGQKEVQILDRTITPQLVVKTVALTVISIIITSFFILLVIKIEPKQSFLAIFFEV
ncbi:MAG: hypothetical protein HN623_10885, partial [Bdellovibrionales bacterium]|nr:hypothetical protein [Bdellovibrionales bacterium]